MPKRINENTVKRIIRDVINEAYGTPPQSDNEHYEELGDLSNSKELLPTVLRTLKDLYYNITDYDAPIDSDMQEATKHIRSAILYTERAIKNGKMSMGLQPDVNYDNVHSKDAWRRGIGNSRPTHTLNSHWPHDTGY